VRVAVTSSWRGASYRGIALEWTFELSGACVVPQTKLILVGKCDFEFLTDSGVIEGAEHESGSDFAKFLKISKIFQNFENF